MKQVCQVRVLLVKVSCKVTVVYCVVHCLVIVGR